MANSLFNTLDAKTSRGAWSQFNEFEDIVPAGQYQGDVASELAYPQNSYAAKNPFSKEFLLRPGELTVWAGENGAGKSALMNQLMLSMLNQGMKVCLFSFEMRPVITVMNMMKCGFGRSIRPDDIIPFFDWCDKKLWLYRTQGALSAEYCYDGVFYAAQDLKCRHVVVDNLMMLTSGTSSDTLLQSQKTIVQTLKQIANTTGVHIHLVAHLRKPSTSNPHPNRYDICGNSDISNLADNVVLIRRNREKEQFILDGNLKSQEWDEKPDTLLQVDKQRATGDISVTPLWFDKPSGQFCSSCKRQLMELMPQSITHLDTTKPHQWDALQGLKERKE